VIRSLVALALLIAAPPAAAERLVIGLATETVAISSNFQGMGLALFAVIQPDQQGGSRLSTYDAAIIVRGPARVQVVRRKDRIGPIWVNSGSRTYVASPSYHATLTNRPLEDIAGDRVRAEAGLGLASLQLIQPWSPNHPAEDAAYREAFLNNRRDEGLYIEAHGEDGLRFLAPNVFRATISIPANAPIGFYTVEVLVLSEGFVVGRESTTFQVEKVGFEAAVFNASREQPLAYGIATVALALSTGWLAGIVFRRN
jgi:uncharacterized protein (TIGR02186 family)